MLFESGTELFRNELLEVFRPSKHFHQLSDALLAVSTSKDITPVREMSELELREVLLFLCVSECSTR